MKPGNMGRPIIDERQRKFIARARDHLRRLQLAVINSMLIREDFGPFAESVVIDTYFTDLVPWDKQVQIKEVVNQAQATYHSYVPGQENGKSEGEFNFVPYYSQRDLYYYVMKLTDPKAYHLQEKPVVHLRKIGLGQILMLYAYYLYYNNWLSTKALQFITDHINLTYIKNVLIKLNQGELDGLDLQFKVNYEVNFREAKQADRKQDLIKTIIHLVVEITCLMGVTLCV